MDVEWSSLHKILNDTTRRSILELLSERHALSYTEIMSLLQITNTGRLNYHLKALRNLISKDDEGRYRLTERGQLAVSLLKTFPERVPAKKPSILKISTAVVLILIGILLIATFSAGLLGLTSPVYSSSSEYASMPSQAIAQNTTISLTSFTSSGTPFSISWNASGPVHIYVLNQTQDDVLLLQHQTSEQALQNFSGLPASSVEQYYGQTGNHTLSLAQGQYYFFAGSSAQMVLLDSFAYGLTQHQTEGPSSVSPFVYLVLSVFLALGVLMIVLAFSILTRRIWR